MAKEKEHTSDCGANPGARERIERDPRCTCWPWVDRVELLHATDCVLSIPKPPEGLELMLAHMVCAAAADAFAFDRNRSVTFTRALAGLQFTLLGPTPALATMLAFRDSHGEGPW